MLLFAFASIGIVQLLIYVLVFLIVLSVVYYLVNSLAPEPIKKYAIAIVLVIAVIALLLFVTQMFGSGSDLKL